MSGQSSLIIIVGLIAAIIFLWGMNTYSQSTIKTRVVVSSEIEKIKNYIDIVKGFSRLAVQIAANKATAVDASSGRTFYCNGPTPPSVNVILHDLEIYTNYTFNDYIQKIKFSDPLLDLSVYPALCTNFDVVHSRLRLGIYDEKFNVNVYGSYIDAKYGDNQQVSVNEIEGEAVVRNRFWFLYRGFREWATKTRALDSSNVCSCLSKACSCPNIDCCPAAGCEDCGRCPDLYLCIKSLVRQAVEELDGIFKDAFIECKAELDSCVLNVENIDCSISQPCTSWADDICFKCNLDSEEDLCSSGINYGLARAQAVTPTGTTLYNCHIQNKHVKYKTKVIFTCVDKKYALPIEAVPEEQYLKYRVTAYLSFHQPGVCPVIVSSTSPIPSACDCAAAPPAVAPGPGPIPAPPPQPPPQGG